MLNVTLSQLEYIVALDTYRHFVTAAEKCFVTQPTLSMQIKKLEEQLNIVLFDRSKQPIIPTGAGEKIIKQARIILSEANKINDILLEYRDTVAGELTIGIIPTIAPYLLPRFIGNFTKAYPKVKLKVRELLTEEIIAELKNDTLDVGIVVTPLAENNIMEQPLFYEKFKAYLAESHKSFNSGGPVSVNELTTEKLWLLSEGNCFRDQVFSLCNIYDNKSDLFFDYESGSIETLIKIVDIEGGATVVPEFACTYLHADQLKHIKPIEEDNAVREVSLVYSRNFAKRKLMEALQDKILEAIPDGMKKVERKEVIPIKFR